MVYRSISNDSMRPPPCQNANSVICYSSTCSVRHKYGNRIPISKHLPAGSFFPLYFALFTLFHASSTWMLQYNYFFRCMTSATVALIPETGFMRNRHKKRRILMDETKRKEIETLLRRLINAADRDTRKPERNIPRPPGNIQVIRRRKGRPDLHID